VLGKRSGLVVVDVDPQNNGSLQAVLDRYGWDKMKTRTVATPSGGHHLDYSYPNGVDNLPKRINVGKWIDGLGGVDLLADGHHVIAPPTIRVGHPTKTDGAYRVIGDHPVVPMPEQLLDDWLGSLEIKPGRDGEPVDRIPESDDRALSQMCSKARLLEIMHDFMVFDAGVKKTCRHNQHFGVKAARPKVQRASSRTTVRQTAHAGDVTSMSE
jgi:hypothetical protein